MIKSDKRLTRSTIKELFKERQKKVDSFLDKFTQLSENESSFKKLRRKLTICLAHYSSKSFITKNSVNAIHIFPTDKINGRKNDGFDINSINLQFKGNFLEELNYYNIIGKISSHAFYRIYERSFNTFRNFMKIDREFIINEMDSCLNYMALANALNILSFEKGMNLDLNKFYIPTQNGLLCGSLKTQYGVSMITWVTDKELHDDQINLKQNMKELDILLSSPDLFCFLTNDWSPTNQSSLEGFKYLKALLLNNLLDQKIVKKNLKFGEYEKLYNSKLNLSIIKDIHQKENLSSFRGKKIEPIAKTIGKQILLEKKTEPELLQLSETGSVSNFKF
jgi:hypothetical protein